MRSELKRGGSLTILAQACKFFLKIGSTAVLARYIAPADFGLVAMVTVVTGFLEMFKDAGLAMATVQQKQITHEQVSTLFWINCLLGLTIMVMIICVSPGLCAFYGEPRLFGIAAAISVSSLITSAGIQSLALIRRKMQYLKLASVDIGSSIIGALIGIIFAARGFGYWALVLMLLGGAIASTAFSLFLGGWLPGMPVRGAGVRKMLKFGGELTGFNVMNYFARQGDNFLIGRFFGAVDLGIYSKAYGLLLQPISQINAPVSRVVVPLLCRLTEEPERFRRCYCGVLRLIALVTLPSIALASIYSNQIIHFVLGPNWEAAGAVFRSLALASAAGVLCNTTGWLYVSLGRSREMMAWGIWSSIIVVISFICGLPWGIMGVARAYSVCSLVLMLPCFYFATMNSPVSMKDVAVSCFPGILLTVVVYVGAISL